MRKPPCVRPFSLKYIFNARKIMWSQQETPGAPTLANSANVRLATSYWVILIHMTRITSLRRPHFRSGSCLKCPINLDEFCLRSNVCNQFSADCTSRKLTDNIDGAHIHLSVRRLGLQLTDRDMYRFDILCTHLFSETTNAYNPLINMVFYTHLI
jgi:hypothetical protein